MKRGTLSILVGVHQFLWHPFTVWRAWRYLYKKNPTWVELVAIFCHDLGYWGKPDMDGEAGRTHPEGGANLACYIVYYLGILVYARRKNTRECAMLMSESVRELCLWHSTHYAQLAGGHVSALYLPDKVCILFDPPWFYKLRARLSGEWKEYVDRENHVRWLRGESIITGDEWLISYRVRNQKKADDYLAVVRDYHRAEMLKFYENRFTDGA